MIQTHFFSAPSGKAAQYFMLLLSGLIIFYIIYRAAALSLTIDEAVSWINFARPQKVVPEYSPEWLANQHFLNSWLMRASAFVFGESEWAIRLPNIGAGIVYLAYCFAFARNQKPFTAILLFIALTAHPWLLQYFSLARGYGLSYAGIMAGMYYAYRFWNDPANWRYQLYAAIAFLLAVLGNLNVSFFILPFLCVQLIILLSGSTRKNKKLILTAGISIVIIFLLTWLHGRWLVQNHALTHGTDKGFWNGTVSSIILMLQDKASWVINSMAAVKMFIIVSSVTAFIISVVVFVRRREISFSGIIVLAVAATVLYYFLLHLTNGIYYPSERTGLFLLPLFMLGLVLSLAELDGYWILLRYLFSIVLVPALLINFSLHANLSRTTEWAEHEGMKKLCRDLTRLDPKGEKKVGMNWLVMAAFQYYNLLESLPTGGPGGPLLGNLNNDFCIGLKSDVDLHYIDPRFWGVYRDYGNGLTLYRKLEIPANPDRIQNSFFEFNPGEAETSSQAISEKTGEYFLSLDGPSAWSFPIIITSPENPDTADPIIADVQFLYRPHGTKLNAGFFISKPGTDSSSVCHNISEQPSNHKTGEWKSYHTIISLGGKFPASHPLRIQFVNDDEAPIDIDKFSVSLRFYHTNKQFKRL